MVAPYWFRFACRRLFAEKIRTGLVTLSIALTTALSLAVLYASEVNVRAFAQITGFDQNTYPIVLRGHGSPLPSGPASELFAKLRGSFDILMQTRILGRVGPRALDVIGVAAIGEEPTRSLIGVSHSALLNAETQKSLEVQAGDTIRVDIEHSFILLKVESPPNDLVGSIPTGAVIVAADRLSSLKDLSWSTVLLKPRVPLDVERAVAAIQGTKFSSMPQLVVETRSQRVLRGRELLAAFRLNILIMLGLTLLVGTVMIFNGSKLSMLRVRSELSVLRTMGVTRLYCAWLLSGEAIVVSLVGSLVGASLGRPLTDIVTSTLVKSAQSVYQAPRSLTEIGIVDHITVYLVVVFLSLSIGLLGSAHVAWLAFRTEPIVQRDPRVRMPLFLRLLGEQASLILWVLTISGFIGLQIRPFLLLSYATAFFLICAIFFSARSTVGLVGSRLALVSPRWVDASLLSALRSLRDEAGRHGTAVSALAISIAIVTSLGVLVCSFRATLDDWMSSRLRAEFFLGAPNLKSDLEQFAISPLLIDEVGEVAGVDRTARFGQTESIIDAQTVVIAGADIRVNYNYGAYQIRELCSEIGGPHVALVSEASLRTGLVDRCGEKIRIEGKEFLIGAIFAEFSTQLPMIVLDFASFQAIYPAVGARSLAIYTSPNAALVDVAASLRRVTEKSSAEVIEQKTLRTYITKVFDETFLVTKGIRVVLAFLSMATVIVAIWQSVWERRDEFHLRFTLGMSGVEVRRIIALETVLATALAIPVGCLGGALLAVLLIGFINPQSFGWSLAYSWSLVDLGLPVLAIIVGCVSIVWVISHGVEKMVKVGADQKDF